MSVVERAGKLGGDPAHNGSLEDLELGSRSRGSHCNVRERRKRANSLGDEETYARRCKSERIG